MTGPIVVAFVIAIACCLVAAYLLGSLELEETLRQWDEDRRVRASVEAERERLRRLSGPRVMRP